MSKQPRPAPDRYLVLLVSHHGEALVFGDEAGDPLLTRQIAEQFLRYACRSHPDYNGRTVPVYAGRLTAN